MKIATFNINGIKARMGALTDWLTQSAPDIALLQEIKSVDEAFPRAHFEDLGYAVHTHGQKGFNGVAIMSKLPLEDITMGLPGDAEDLVRRRYTNWTENITMLEENYKNCLLSVSAERLCDQVFDTIREAIENPIF